MQEELNVLIKDSLTIEEEYVHQVYDEIAHHFSATRYKPWPVVEDFINSMDEGDIGADVGCGNGKYLGVNKKVKMFGSDRSGKLIEICSEKKHEVMVSDASALPYKDSCFDFTMSIAVIHHFSSPERRLNAIKELFRIAKTGGKILIFVWALEQTKSSKRNFEKQDNFVEWKIPKSTQKAVRSKKYGINEIDNKDKDPEEIPIPKGATLTVEGDLVYKRYYHMFKEGELDQLVLDTRMARILKRGYDRDNWYIIAQKI